jgi:hypothetical protein
MFKKQKMKKKLLGFCVLLSASLSAQQMVQQVYVLNEGYFNYATGAIEEPVILGSYSPTTQAYSIVDTLENMRFASDMIIGDGKLYVAADERIFSYDVTNNQLIGLISLPGVRNLAYAENKLIATRGEYLTTYPSYLHIYDASTLQLVSAIDTVTGPKWATQNMVVNGNKVFIAVNNGYEWGNEKGIIGELDLTTLVYGNEIDLGVDGKNPDNMVFTNGYLYTVNNKDWSGSSISRVDLQTGLANTANIATASTGCGTSCLRNDNIYYQISGETVLNEWSTITMLPVGPVSGLSMNFYELSENPVNGDFYASTTDYTTSGTVHVFDNANNVIHSFQAGVSPGTIVFDVRSTASLIENALELNVFPNPASESISLGNYSGSITIVNSIGQLVLTANVNPYEKISIEGLSSGIYLIQSERSQPKYFVKK